MKVPPHKPHFFKPLHSGFKRGLNIPIGFLKYLKGREECALLRRGGKKWEVKLKARRFKAGWAEFAEEHELQLGDLLVFRHEGNMEFEVIIFDSSHCDREYADYLQQQEEEEEEEEEEEKEKEEEEAEEKEEEEEEGHPIGQSHYECTVQQCCLSKGYLRLTKQFATANGLINKNCRLIIRDERQRSWDLKLSTHRSQVYVLGGWGDFRVANDLRKGDNMMFEVLSNGAKPIWKFHDKRNPSIGTSRTSSNEESANHSPIGQSHFLVTIKPYCLSTGYLYLPTKFAVANGLMNKKLGLVIRDERLRSWELALVTRGSRVRLGGELTELLIANDLKVGDCAVFEVVTHGKRPVWNFYVKQRPNIKSSSNGLPHAEAATQKLIGESYFICSVKPYCLSSDLFYIPKQFARANGFTTNKKCDLIIRGERKKSWTVKLSSFGKDVCIRGGWNEFRDANCLKEGDCMRFDVVLNGNKPIWKFSGKI